ncbi:MAG TPA: response regulator transcription factor [Allosphingosinicella sp.]|nr:response regulator transcription factor [Allosphingosinicella sp.]
MSARILLVEDDPAVLAILAAAVAFGGFASASVSRGEDALLALKAGQFDVLLLDLGLPDCEGGDLLSRLRAFSDIPIIVVSGRGTERDKIEALDLGADDFVAKPFLPGELLARIRAALRRAASRRSASPAEDPARTPLRVGAMTLDPLDNSAALGAGRVYLNAAEFRVLQLLAQRDGETVSRADLLAGFYGERAPAETNVIDVYISRLRAKLRDLPGAEDLVANVRGKGWKLRIPR